MPRLHVPLYVKLWLAVVMAVAVLTLLVGWVWRWSAEPPLREVLVRNAAGQVIGSGQSRMMRPPPVPDADGGPPPRSGPEFTVVMADGQTLHIHMPRPGPPPGQRSLFGRAPFGFLWMLVLVGVAVALATFPIVRRMTQRLETLRAGVERWGSGDLSARVALQGSDEVGYLAERFNHAAQRIESLVQSHKSLLANASHELRSPLARLRMGLELMGTDQVSPARREEMERSIRELDELIAEILLASRLDSPEADVGTAEALDLTGLAAEECARTGAVLDAQGVSVHGVAKLLRRMVRNLLENARRHGDGLVSVTLSQVDGMATLRVCDQGPGVPQDQRERIFEPFYRLPGASERDGGVGLGLALVKSIAQRHGGRVRCEAPADGQPRGACFVVELPALPLTA